MNESSGHRINVCVSSIIVDIYLLLLVLNNSRYLLYSIYLIMLIKNWLVKVMPFQGCINLSTNVADRPYCECRNWPTRMYMGWISNHGLLHCNDWSLWHPTILWWIYPFAILWDGQYGIQGIHCELMGNTFSCMMSVSVCKHYKKLLYLLQTDAISCMNSHWYVGNDCGLYAHVWNGSFIIKWIHVKFFIFSVFFIHLEPF